MEYILARASIVFAVFKVDHYDARSVVAGVFVEIVEQLKRKLLQIQEFPLLTGIKIQ